MVDVCDQNESKKQDQEFEIKLVGGGGEPQLK
jgi:hypothetical protein